MGKLGIILSALLLLIPIAANGPANYAAPNGNGTLAPTLGFSQSVAQAINPGLYPQSLFAPNAPGDPQTPEEMRHLMLDLIDNAIAVQELLGPAAITAAGGQPSAAEDYRYTVKYMTTEELTNMVHHLDHTAFQAFRDGNAALQEILAQAEKSQQDSPQARSGGPSPDYFTIVPTPVPPTAGIDHQNAKAQNIQAGDIKINGGSKEQLPDYATSIGCPTRLYNWSIPDDIGIAAGVLSLVSIGLGLGCKLKAIVCPVPGTIDVSIITCPIKAVVDGAADALKATAAGFILCQDLTAEAWIRANLDNTKIIHSDMIDYNSAFISRANNIDTNIFNFRNLDLRLSIEANLASDEDDPMALYSLPGTICLYGAGYSPTDQGVSAGCGLLEVVRDTVQSTIDMMSLSANQNVFNARTEYQAALDLYNKGQWKLAYARFRKAYREAVRAQ
ncbi:MAG: hypothetical protein EXR62_00085 [Chloroflexi bacterium]|nr:hypothetical protein [Chloroflexota bacterium]